MDMTLSEINNHIKLWHILLASGIGLILAFALRYYSVQDYNKRKNK